MGDAEIEKLALTSETVFVGNEESVVDCGTEVKYLYVVISGSISMEAIDMERYLRPLMILGPGSVFGVETLLDDRKSMCGYRAISVNAGLAAIPAKTVYEVITSNRSALEAFISQQNALLVIFEKLWLLG